MGLQNKKAVLDFLHSCFFFFSGATAISSKGVHIPSLKPSIETATQKAAIELACVGPTPVTKHRITLLDLYDALQVGFHNHSVSLPVVLMNLEAFIFLAFQNINSDETGEKKTKVPLNFPTSHKNFPAD